MRAPLRRQALVVVPQPVEKAQHLLVAPHPGRETLERLARRCRRREMTDIAVDARRIGPIRLDRDDVEPVRGDQPFRDRGARPVEFGGAVRRLAEQHHPGVAEPVEKGAERRVVFRLRQSFACIRATAAPAPRLPPAFVAPTRRCRRASFASCPVRDLSLGNPARRRRFRSTGEATRNIRACRMSGRTANRPRPK